mgnify:CR=1 FL=1|jgi:hypothetical protein
MPFFFHSAPVREAISERYAAAVAALTGFLLGAARTRRRSPTSPSSTAAWMAQPYAITSSGFTCGR